LNFYKNKFLFREVGVTCENTLYTAENVLLAKLADLKEQSSKGAIKQDQYDDLKNQYDQEHKVLLNKRYYEISIGDKTAHDVLEAAFHSGSAVILDKLNLDDSLEALLNQLVEGRDRDGKPAIVRPDPVFRKRC
jgi:hypothetical protein